MPASSRADYLRPSSAGTWFVCHGYAALCASIGLALVDGDDDDESDNEVREDGTACHWLAEVTWNTKSQPAVGALSPNNRVITEEMYDAVALYHEVLLSWLGVAPVIEKKVPSSQAVPGCADGTPDAWAYDPSSRTLYIADLKYGFRIVEVWENLQLIIYVLAIMRLLKLPDDIRVVMTIVQPRAPHRDGPVRTWIVMASELRALANALRRAAREATATEHPPCVVNPGCKHCPARYGCRTLQTSTMADINASYNASPAVMSAEQLSMELRMLEDARDRIEARLTGLQTQGEYMVRKGMIVPGYTLRAKQGRRRWKPDLKEHVVRLGNLYHLKLAAPPEPISPARARDAGLPQDVLDRYTEVPSAGLRFSREDRFEVRKAFAKYPMGDTSNEQ